MEPGVLLPCSQELATGPVLSHIGVNPVHTLKSYSFKIHFNIIRHRRPVKLELYSSSPYYIAQI
jgi:hypothetical protein